MAPAKPTSRPGREIHLWSAPLGPAVSVPADRLPAADRERAARITRPAARRRWLTARWALRTVLAHYLDAGPDEVELRLGPHGKPALAGPGESLRFNLSHSGELALVAVAAGREVGVDVERIRSKPAAYYAAWTRHEAIVKCLGVGLWAPLPEAPVAVSPVDPGAGFVASVAIAGEEVPPLRRFVAPVG
jgi:4'-phosphopantetheinyl transferase